MGNNATTTETDESRFRAAIEAITQARDAARVGKRPVAMLYLSHAIGHLSVIHTRYAAWEQEETNAESHE